MASGFLGRFARASGHALAEGLFPGALTSRRGFSLAGKNALVTGGVRGLGLEIARILVAKGARGGVTTADVEVLSGDARVTEVARMLGGDPESDLSRAHARELLDSATVPVAAPPTSPTPQRKKTRS